MNIFREDGCTIPIRRLHGPWVWITVSVRTRDINMPTELLPPNIISPRLSALMVVWSLLPDWHCRWVPISTSWRWKWVLPSLVQLMTSTVSIFRCRGFQPADMSHGASESRLMQQHWQTCSNSRRAAVTGIMAIRNLSFTCCETWFRKLKISASLAETDIFINFALSNLK